MGPLFIIRGTTKSCQNWILYVPELRFGNRGRTPPLFDDLCHCSLPLCLNFHLFEVLGYLPSLPLVSFEFLFNMCCIVKQNNGRTTSSTTRSRYSSVWSLPAECICRASVKGRRSHSHRNALETFECHSTNVVISMSVCVSWTNWQVKWAISLLMPCVTRKVMNSRKS